MGMTADELSARMLSEELTERMLMEHIDPLDSWRQLAEMLAALFNVNRSRETEPFKPLDILASLCPGYEPPTHEQTDEEMGNILRGMANG